MLPCAAGLLLAGCTPSPTGGASPASLPAAAPGWTVSALPQRWELRGFSGDLDLSGMASWDGIHALVCSDEVRFIESGIIRGGTVTASGRLPLLAGGDGGKELDAEGVAVARPEHCYYVTGSHGVGKKKGDYQASRCRVFRIPVDPATGEARAEGIQSAGLLPWVESDPVLGRYAGRPLQDNGFNLEGLAWKDGKLWFGVRAPNVDGDAFVIETGGASLFSGKPAAKLHRLAVGAGWGIREIAALRDGFLLVTGAAASGAGRDDDFYFFFWQPGRAPVPAGAVPAPPGKAEGLYILGETERTIDVLVLFDGAPGGGPRAFRLTKS